MSEFSVIAGVTRTLVELLEDRMREAVTVTAASPGTRPRDHAGARVNLFLYRIDANEGLRNHELPETRSLRGSARPAVPLTLHYLLYAEPPDPADDAAAHQILGDAMMVLHEVPVVTSELRRRTGDEETVFDAALMGAVQLLRIDLDPLSTEDLTRLWTATTSQYRLSVAYTVTVV